MSEEQWQAPGHEHDGRSAGPATGGGTPPQPLPPAHAASPPPAPPSPYAGPAPSSLPGLSDPYASPGSSAFGTSDRHRDQVLGGPGYHTPAYRNHPAAVTALVLGVVGIIVPGIALFAIAVGHLALHRLRSSYEGGRGLALAGLVLGYAMLALWLAVLALRAFEGLML